ncbi:MAG: fibronectin type III domain-containing protein, partial [Actinobacteria bacterium]|nr:fibronectin type III domain-containing protein [Actinomycetota bacterium]
MSGLAAGTAYTFQVTASNAYGDGAVATSSAVTPTGSPTTYVTNVLANAPSAYYRLGESSGTTAADSSGKGGNGLYDQATLGSTGAVAGDPDTAAVANGNCCVVRAAPTLPLYNTARSVEAWVKPSDTYFRYIAGWGTAATDRGFSVNLDGSNIGVVAYGDDRYFALPRPLNDGVWHHVVVTYNGTTVVAYLDGLSLGTKTFSAPLATSPSGLQVGAGYQESSPFYGGLDEVAVYPTALTAAQVGAHFSASGYSRPAAVTNLTATPGSNQATVSWSPATSPGTPVTRYLVTAYAGTVAKNAEATDGSNTSLVMSGLAAGTAYTFQVTASNAYGDGPVATSTAVTPTGVAMTYASSVLADA